MKYKSKILGSSKFASFEGASSACATLLALSLCAVYVAPATAQNEATALPSRPMTVDDALDMKRVSQAVISPDGHHVLYSEEATDWDKNKRKTKVYMVSSQGGDRWQYLSDEGGRNYSFSPDGAYVTFLRRAESKNKGGASGGGSSAGNNDRQQLYWMRTAGGEAVQLTKHKTSIRSYKWAADSKSIFFVANDKIEKNEDKALKAGGDAVFVNEGPNGQDLGSWTNLWTFDLESEESKQLTEEEFIVSSFDPTPDGSRIALTARSRNRRNDGNFTEIFVLDVSAGDLKKLSENDAPESDVLWSPQGKLFTFAAADDKKWKNRNTKIWLMDPDLGEHSLVSKKFEGSVRNVVWAPDGQHVMFTGQQGTQSNLFRIDIRSGNFEQVTQTDGWLQVQDYSSDRTKVVYSYSDYRTPQDFYFADLTQSDASGIHGPVSSTRLTDANPGLRDLALGSMEVIRWTSKDGTAIEGLVHYPIDYQKGESYPLMLNIHGGPAGFFSNSFRAAYHVYSGLGYVSLSPNVRGSSGYTDALREGNTTEKEDGIGLGDYQDLMTGVDSLIERGLADPDKLGLRGWSYGGILGGWTITQTTRFKAASIGAGVYDWTSEYGPGFNHDVRLWHIGSTPWENPDGYRNQSTLTFVKNIETPTLLLHGDADTTDTEQQSMMLFAAIQDIGKAPVRYIKFPRQPHGIREPRLIRIKDIEEIRWMQEHILGQEWEAWERKPKKDESDEDSKDSDDSLESTDSAA